MRVSSRIRVIPPYDSSDFVEMRFFRFMADSKKAAIWFSILEEAKTPQGAEIGKTFLSEIGPENGIMRRAIEYSIHQNVNMSDILSIWNLNNFFFQIINSAFELISGTNLQYLENLYEIRNFSEEVSNPNGKLQIYLLENENNVIVFYQEYEISSFCVTNCGHVHLKSELFHRGLEQSGRWSLDATEFSRLEIKCGSIGCEENLAELIFKLGLLEGNSNSNSANNTFNGILDENIPISELVTKINDEKCRICQENVKKLHLCVNHCEICQFCLIKSTFSRLSWKCPICGFVLRDDLIDEIVDFSKSIVGLKIDFRTARCKICQKRKRKAEFSRSLNRKSDLLSCNECIQITVTENFESSKAANLSQLSFPNRNFPDERRNLSQIESSFLNDRECSYCQQRKKIEGFSIQILLSDPCLICNTCYYTHIANFRLISCPKCSKVYSESDLIQMSQMISAKFTEKGIRIFCIPCGKTKSTEDFSYAAQLSHWWKCRMCNECFDNRFFHGILEKPRCSLCNTGYTPEDQSSIKQAKMSSKMSSIYFQISEEPEKQCECGRKITRGKFYCRNFCLCSFCLYSNYLLTESQRCVKCNSECVGPRGSFYNCSKCFRYIDSKPITKAENRVFGVCKNGCILCGFCINLESSCSNCHSTVNIKSIVEIMTFQANPECGCYCLRSYKGDVLLECGHLAHRECLETIYVCRVCGKVRNPPPSRSYVKDFISD